VLSVTPVPIVFEIGALLPVEPDEGLVVGVVLLVPLPHAASSTATTSTIAMRNLVRAFTSVSPSCVGRTLRAFASQRW
jgi:hypothetical protein